MQDSEKVWKVFHKYLNLNIDPQFLDTQYKYGGWMIDLGENIFYADDYSSNIFGICLDEDTGKPLDIFLDFVIPEHREKVINAINNSARTGEGLAVNYRIKKIQGDVRSILALGRAHLDDSGNPTHIYGVVADITKE